MTDAQGSLFGDGRMSVPQRATTPDPETIRGRLDGLLGTLRAAETMPLSERDARMWSAVVPNMTRWLPEAEAAAIRTAFAREMDRLRQAA
ncbi:hypothetical protein STAQ_37830 [Allostella sp. ATCC 35155]|nr:hypothetical protein STAQ_37830 [Stella sp. ATCC 35155]